MDDIALITLARELQKDGEVAAAAFVLAEERLHESAPSGLEGCAHHLARFFNVVEQMALRVAKAFENNIDDEKGWHAELIRRMTLEIPGVRPALWRESVVQPLRELRAFRHVFTHAYELTLDPDKLRLLLKYAGVINGELGALIGEFANNVAKMHGLRITDG
ncbi:MAG: hypothetical protein M3Q89_00735 [Verrucomicrobiota bacterium]|nr:hypothetical protein [Verrucomicrobiota bacterium]